MEPIFTEFNELNEPWDIQYALDALKKRDGSAFACAGSRGRALGLVFDNMALLKKRGMYEAALLTAFCSVKTNYHHWSLATIKGMFDEADRMKLQSLGITIPAEPVIAYRAVAGVGKNRRVKGLSWTTSLDMACWFAWRTSSWLENPAVFKCVFDPKDIYVIHNQREEDELIGLAQKPVNCKLTVEQMTEGFSRIVEMRQEKFLEKEQQMAKK